MSEKDFNAIARQQTGSLGLYVDVIVLAVVAPKIAAFGYLVIAVVAVLRARGDDTPPLTATSA